MPESDAELLSAISRGDEAAFNALYLRHRDWVYRIAARFARDRDEAGDVVQETFAHLLRRAADLKLRAKLTTYLYPVIRSIALTHRRKTKRLITGHTPEHAGEAGWKPEGELGALIADIAEPYREVLLMRVIDEMSIEEVSLALGIPEGTVKSRLHKAIALARADPRAEKYFD